MNTDDQSTVMVLEPDGIVRTEISEFLRGCGYFVIEGVAAQDVWSALEVGAHLDVVLSEVHLKGGRSGFELAHELRSMHPEIAVILVSNVANVVDKADDLCGRGPLKKPYHPQEVLRRIRVLSQHRGKTGRAAGIKD